MIVNLIHRPAPGSQYEMFRLQQEMAHSLGLKVTLLLPYDFLFDERTLRDVREDHARYGDELGLWLGELTGGHMAQEVESPEPFLWLHSRDNKEKILRAALGKFSEALGGPPAAFGAYHMDAISMELLHRLCPTVKITIAGCFEEGVKVFHGCNNSWYLFNEGMPWFPWYPARENSLRPAVTPEEWCGIVAVPHLARDLALSFEGRNDFFASHPANVQRAMANDGATAPYVLNLLDVYRFQERLNQGFSYTNVFVGPNWLSGSPYVQDSDEVTQGLYRAYLEYFVTLREQGKLQDMHMSEFADWFRSHVPVGTPQLYDAREILYGGGKRYVWYCDSDLRVTFDLCQGGSIGDLRPFVARLPRSTGADRPEKAIGSNPYLIQSQYRTGNAHHHADGARSTLLLTHGGETLDLADVPAAAARVERSDSGLVLELKPVELRFSDGLEVAVQTTIRVERGGKIRFSRALAACSQPEAELLATEYVKGCWGVTEYPEPMEGIVLLVRGARDTAELTYRYGGRTLTLPEAAEAAAALPQLGTTLGLTAVAGETVCASVDEGYVFNPYYTLRVQGHITREKGMETALWLEKNDFCTAAPSASAGKTT